jgi:hypothetical protein
LRNAAAGRLLIASLGDGLRVIAKVEKLSLQSAAAIL